MRNVLSRAGLKAMTRSKTDGNRAFSILELIALLLVLSILAAAVVPLVLRPITARRKRSTLREMEAIRGAIVGNPSEGHYGFIGDLGRLPDELSQLVDRGPYPLYHNDTAYKVGMGWNGPYLQAEQDDLLNDEFGTPYEFGRKAPGQIRSAGPDALIDTDDDIVYPPAGIDPLGTVRIELSGKGDYTVRLYYSNGGTEKFLEALEAPYIFEDVHTGPHATEVFRRVGDELELATQTMIILSGAQGIFKVEF